MVRKALTVSALSAIAVAAACSTFGSGGDDDATGNRDDGGGPDATSVSDGPSPGADGGAEASPDASTADAAPCDLAEPVGTFYRATLDDSCEGWKVSDGTIEPVSDPKRCGAGSCKVCVNGAGEAVLNRDVAVERTNGTFELTLQVRGDTLTGTVNVNLYVFADGGQTGFNGNSAPLVQGEWRQGQAIATNAATPSDTLLLRMVSPLDAGGLCYFVDEIKIGHY